MAFATHIRSRGLCAEAMFDRLSAIMSEDGSTRPPRAVLPEDRSTRPRRSASPSIGSVLEAQGCRTGGGGGFGTAAAVAVAAQGCCATGGGGGTAAAVDVGGAVGAGMGGQRSEAETEAEAEVEADCGSYGARVEVAGTGNGAAAAAVGAAAVTGCREAMDSRVVVQSPVQVDKARVSRGADLDTEGGLEREQRQARGHPQQPVSAAAAAADSDEGAPSRERHPILWLQAHHLQQMHPMTSGEVHAAPAASAGAAYGEDGTAEARPHCALLSPRGLSPPASRQPSAALLASSECSMAAGALDRTMTLSVIFA